MHCYSLDWHPSDHVSFFDNVHLRKLNEDSMVIYNLHACVILDNSSSELYQTVVFTGPPKTEQVLWPRHCVQESWGAELHKDLKVGDDNKDIFDTDEDDQVHPKGRVVYKGVNPNIDSYSAFFDNSKLGKTCLEELIRNEGCTDVFVCGIAMDVCVGKN